MYRGSKKHCQSYTCHQHPHYRSISLIALSHFHPSLWIAGPHVLNILLIIGCHYLPIKAPWNSPIRIGNRCGLIRKVRRPVPPSIHRFLINTDLVDIWPPGKVYSCSGVPGYLRRLTLRSRIDPLETHVVRKPIEAKRLTLPYLRVHQRGTQYIPTAARKSPSPYIAPLPDEAC